MKIKHEHLKFSSNEDIINIVTRNPIQHNVENEILHILTEEELPQYNMKDDTDRILYVKRYDSVMTKLKYIISSKLNILLFLCISLSGYSQSVSGIFKEYSGTKEYKIVFNESLIVIDSNILTVDSLRIIPKQSTSDIVEYKYCIQDKIYLLYVPTEKNSKNINCMIYNKNKRLESILVLIRED